MIKDILEEYNVEEKEVFDFLENLRESGVTNMFGASPYLSEQFGFDIREAKKVLVYWFNNYDKYKEA